MSESAYNKTALQYAEHYLDQLLRRTDFGRHAASRSADLPQKTGKRGWQRKRGER
ncbi:MAG: hypothetical protein IJM81_09130 [Prevotella sp.]|nr:hypothetical protein [Prevotella sp.]